MVQEKIKININFEEWTPINKLCSFSTWDYVNTEVKFDDGTICHYWDDWPPAIVTHFRVITNGTE